MAEGVPLLRVYLGNWIEGSNPSFSAIFPLKSMTYVNFVILNFLFLLAVWSSTPIHFLLKKPIGPTIGV